MFYVPVNGERGTKWSRTLMHTFSSKVLLLHTTRRRWDVVLYVCLRLYWSFCCLNIWKHMFCWVSPLLPRTESWALTSRQQLPFPSHEKKKGPSTLPLYSPILACMKGLDCSRPEQWRITPELPSRWWVKSGGKGILKSRENVAILVSQNPKIKEKKKNRGHAFFTFYFSTSAFCAFIPRLRLRKPVSYECISLLLFYS